MHLIEYVALYKRSIGYMCVISPPLLPWCSVSDQSISTVAFNATGEWVCLGCAGLGQLLVWEWQSESYILKQQGHFNTMACLQYSPDGQYVATGGDDGKVLISVLFAQQGSPRGSLKSS